ncbi:related to GPI anchored protein [Melanopsichium pennsylvanicum]|uniref:Related to GPI anchored protein n=2 Tax=Melanopsichium pennsylvanicum TaxID=63383 RepID=A0AAJ5C7W2_9BASI|nr:exopolysaccharide inner membrane protein [Melanopsichium pennsylvanicum 4]SNX87362.1 related to GPI anchored protein [Melanopsichium pennsylvanicum]
MLLSPLLKLFLITAVSGAAVVPRADTFKHPGLLHTEEDFARIRSKLASNSEPWVQGYRALTNNGHSKLGYEAAPVAGLCRGINAGCQENYSRAFNDFAAAYQHALRWKISNDTAFADGAVAIVNAWSTTLKNISGISSDRFLAAGIYGYQFANVVELLKDYSGFSEQNLTSAKNLLTDIFLPHNIQFLTEHGVDGPNDEAFWANWDLCNYGSALAIGVVTDNRTTYDFAMNYFYNGGGRGSIHNYLWKTYNDSTAQGQEAGRDQGHSMLDLALLGPFATTALNQGDDVWAYNDSLILKGAEYAAKYNLGYDVQYTPYLAKDAKGRVLYNQTTISNVSRGNIRPIWDMYYNQYVVKRGLNGTYTKLYADKVRAANNGSEGGGGDYGPNSGGYDQLGFGTLMYTLDNTRDELYAECDE